MRVLHLVGSPSDEFYADLSRLYAQDCLTATADPARYEFVVAYIGPDGRWRFPDGLSPEAIAAAVPFTLSEALARITDDHLDVVVPQLFCRAGMTSYRALFDVIGIPYVGNPAEVMALGADKALTRAVVAAAGVAVPEGEVLRHGEQPMIEPPVVVKPADADNSLGVALVRDPADFDDALREAFVHSERVLVERYVELGREVRCGVVVRDGVPTPLPLEEYSVDPDTKPVRDHADKIARDGDDLRLMAKDATHAWFVDPADPVTKAVWDVALTCHEALGCRDYSLFDFRIDPDGRPWFLEAGLYCSFAKQSVVVMMAAAAGIELPDLFAEQLAAALGRATAGRPAG